MGRSNPKEKYVPWKEGAEIIGVERSAFFYYVRNGNIKPQEGTPPKQGRYRLSDILEVKAKRDKSNRKRYARKDKVDIDWLYTSDLPAGIKLAQQRYHEDVDLAEAAVYESWRKNNPHITLGAFNADRTECYASIQIIPVDESVALDVLSKKRTENSIKPDEIRGYNEPGPYTLLGTSAIVLPEYPELLYRLIYRYMEYWLDMYPTRYMSKLYAQTVSETGDKLASSLYMAPLYHLDEHAFMLDFARPGRSRLIRQFQEKLEAKEPLPPELHRYA